jgi:hypothetical protein
MADLNTTLRLALRSPKEPLNSQPVEALHFPGPIGGGGESSGPPAPQSPVEAMAMALKAVAGGKPAAASGGAAAIDPPSSPVKVIDGDHYSAPEASSSQ